MSESKKSIEGILRPGLASEIERIMGDLGLCDEGRQYVRAAVAAPSRRVQAGIKNVSGIYPSRKVGVGIGFEARTTELPEILNAEWDTNTVAYFDQAPSLVLRYEGKNGRARGYRQRPDFVRIYCDKIVLRECKTEQELTRRSNEDPSLFLRDSSGRWRCPPAEQAAAEMGLAHQLAVDADTSPTRSRNLRVLIDYVAGGEAFENHSATQQLCELVSHQKRLSITEALDQLKGIATVDDVYRAIALTDVTVNIDQDWIGEHTRCFLYPDAPTLEAYLVSAKAIATAGIWVRANIVDVRVGEKLNWDGHIWTVVNLGATEAVLMDGATHHPIPRGVMDELIKEGRIRAYSGGTDAGNSRTDLSYKLIQAATPLELERALSDLKSIQPHLDGTASEPTSRSQRRKLQNWRKGEASIGNGFVGLLPHFSNCGNRTPRLEKAVLEIVRTQTDLHYANPKKVRRLRVYERIAKACKDAAHQVPSYGWFCQYLHRRPSYDLMLAREGRRRSYRLEPRVEQTDLLLPQKADFAFQKAYIDHTQLDIETCCSVTSKLIGKPWLTTIVDGNSVDVIGQYLSYDPPSYRSVMMALRDCVERHGRMPESIVVDGGKEFQSMWFEATCAYFGVTIIRRAKSKPRFGSRGERLFGTINSTFIHCLAGNTQLRKYIREMSAEVDPNNFAVWTFAALQDALEKCFEEYRNLPHREILMSPLEARLQSQQRMGSRQERRIAYDQDFLICTSPTTDRGQAKVQPDGLKINYLYYSAPELRLHIGKMVPVRFNPCNMAEAYALITGKWIRLRSRFYAELRGRGERELRIAREEYKKRRSDVEKLRLSESSFVKFLLQLDATEEMLIEHHRSIEMRRAAAQRDDQDDIEPAGEENLSPRPTDHVPAAQPKASHSRDPFDLSGEELHECEEY
jgi:transposase InsO family protein